MLDSEVMEETLAIIKPDAIKSARSIMSAITKGGFEIVARRTVQMTAETAAEFYGEHEGKPFFEGLITHMASGLSRVMVLRRKGAIGEWRRLMGPTNPTDARIEAEELSPLDDSYWSLRAKFGSALPKNATHGSDAPESARREIRFFFGEAMKAARHTAGLPNVDTSAIESKQGEGQTKVEPATPAVGPRRLELSNLSGSESRLAAPPPPRAPGRRDSLQSSVKGEMSAPPASRQTLSEDSETASSVGRESSSEERSGGDVITDLRPSSALSNKGRSSRASTTSTTSSESRGFLAQRRASVIDSQAWALPTGVKIEDVSRIFTRAVGEFPSMEHRVQFFYRREDNIPVQISPWHDIPLKNDDGTFNMLVEIPKWTRAKMEIDTKDVANAIKQDIKDGELREYKWGDMAWNYGAFSQTWEDPSHTHEDTGAIGDNDPLDVIDVGCRQHATGSVQRVKILAVLGMIDDGETDWKVLVISAEDPMASEINNLDDLQRQLPGCVDAITHWLKMYKSHKGVVNEFAFDSKPQPRDYALRVIEETHEAWRGLVSSRQRRLSTMS